MPPEYYVSPLPPEEWVDWRDGAACRGVTFMFDPDRVEDAKNVCRICPVYDDCLAWIRWAQPEVLGVVAGMTPRQRGFVSCVECGRPIKKPRRGRCMGCYTYLREQAHGD